MFLALERSKICFLLPFCIIVFNTLMEKSIYGKSFCDFRGFWKIRKSLFPQKSKVSREPQNFFSAKRSSFAEPQKFIPVKCVSEAKYHQ